MTKRPARPPLTSPAAKVWASLADDYEAARHTIADLHRDSIMLARDGIVSTDRARPLLTGRATDDAGDACRALARFEQAARNEAARLERRGPR